MGESKSQIDVVAEQLLDMYLDPAAQEMQHIGSYELPSEQQVESVIEQCRALLFPGYAGPDVHRGSPSVLRDIIRARMIELRLALHRQVYRAMHHKRQPLHGRSERECMECATKADTITDQFLAHLPELRRRATLDLHAAYESDPAASGVDEILFCYPGIYAIIVYRIAHALLREGAVVIPRMMTELAHNRTGVDIHPGAEIGESFFIDHGTGVVIGQTTLIGDRVRIYQGVTLGALTVPQGENRPNPGDRRHPTLEDDVVIYANATILGGQTVIGKGSVIGGNAFVTKSVPPGARISGSARTQR
ncbi:MAG TPA: serine O-acetyltransferase EpsC [Kofleriaceae bacterium]|jgi:serine O-acetyltransferase|nr:serine O-acetyltransferase EpsC [Kofleriaceae bacterium]